MHDTSFETMRMFVHVHLAGARGHPLEVLDFGSQVVDEQPRSYRELFDDPAWRYRGLDIEPGRNVDVVVDDAYSWHAIEADSVDLVVSGQAFEHVEFFWASMFEIVRVLRPGGLAAIIAPSGGFEHRYPVDCWRFYPDGFRALARYVDVELIDVFTDWQHGEWDDSILVVRKPRWDVDGRLRFAGRALLQRRLLDVDVEQHAEPPPPGGDTPPSILRDVSPGALTDALEWSRDERLRREAEAAQAVAEAESVERSAREAAAAAEREATIAAEAERLASERLEAITPVRWYGRARATVSDLVGERGRAAYRRLRNR